MVTKLPPLPAPDRVMWQYGEQINHYSEAQMQAYAEAARSQEYENTSLVRALQREKELQEQVVTLRQELRYYREREKTMGWNQN